MQDFQSIDFAGKRALIRVDFNVPLNEQLQITDDTRILAALPSIKSALARGASVVLMSHLGRPKERESEFSMKNLIPTLEGQLETEVSFDDMNSLENTRLKTLDLDPGEVLLLENLRYDKREKAGDLEFAKALASLGDVYVNDAFGTAHRAHASTAIIAQFAKEKCFGLLMEKEIDSLNKVLHEAQGPVTAIIGGAKVSSKLDVLLNLIERCDNIIVGGGMAYTFAKALGGSIGNSLFEEDKIPDALDALKRAEKNNTQILLPVDTIIADDFSNAANSKNCPTSEIPESWMGLDIGIETREYFSQTIAASKTILWNGPMGVFEFENFATGTVHIANSIVRATENGAFSLVGGGDSVAALKKFSLANKVSYVSTGGGAMLEYMEGKTLPGIAAIQSS
ncbi:MAG: phosphoglycerate kinase [Bacteroidota bacterium]